MVSEEMHTDVLRNSNSNSKDDRDARSNGEKHVSLDL
jgi:hypothetical protein